MRLSRKSNDDNKDEDSSHSNGESPTPTVVQTKVLQPTALGVARMAQAGPLWKKIMWAIIFLLTVVGFSYHLSILIIKYQQYPVTTEYKEDVNAFQFPSVTICPTNTISPYGNNNNSIPSKYNNIDFNISFHDMMKNVPRVWHTIQNQSVIYGEAFRNYWNARMSLKSIAYRTRLFQAAYETILYCKFNNQPCSYRNFTEYKDPQYFLCFTFTPNNSSVVNSGENSGLYLVLYNKGTAHFTQEEEIDAVEGFVVKMHQPKTAPNSNKNIRVPYRKKVNGPIQMKKINKVNRVTAPCLESRPQVTYIVDWSKSDRETATFTETKQDCIIRAKQLEFLRRCDCLAEHLPIPKDLFAQSPLCHHLSEDLLFMKTKAIDTLNNNTKQDGKRKSPSRPGRRKRRRGREWWKRNTETQKVTNYIYMIQKNIKEPYMNLTDYIHGSNWNKFEQFQKKIMCFNKVDTRQLQEGVTTECIPDCKNTNYDVNSIHMSWPRKRRRPELTEKSLNYLFEDTWLKIKEDNIDTIIINKTSEENSRTMRFDINTRQAAVLDLYAISPNVEILKEDLVYEMGSLFSDLGGILGLWIGISIITIAEIVEIIVALIYSFKMKKSRSNSQRQSKKSSTKIRQSNKIKSTVTI